MKKFLTLLLVVLIGFSFAGCNDNKNNVAVSIENNVNRLSKLLETTKEITEEDILIKQIHSDSNYVTTNATTNTVIENESQNKNSNNRIVEDNKTDNLVDLNNKIENMPRPEANTQIVKSEDTPNSTKKQEILKAGSRAVKNIATNQKNLTINRLTNGSYKPRKVSNLNYNNAGLQNYLSKIEDLYLMMNDAVCANNECNGLKSAIKENCNMLNGLCGELKNNKINLNSNQIQACNDLLSGLNKNTNTLNKTKNEVETQCNAVKKMNVNPSANLEQISSKYVKLINCLDDKITCYSNILSILTQLKCTITGICENENIEEGLNIEKGEEEIPLENIPQTLPYFPPEDTERIEDFETDAINKLNEEHKNKKINAENRKLIKNRKKYPTSKDRDESVTLTNENTEKVANFDNKSPKKNNLDTFKDATIKPNIQNNKNVKNDEKIKNEENNNSQNNENLPNNNPNNGINNNLINSTNNAPIVNGMNPVVNGINPAINGVGNNVITNGYGIHNYENGITNPYRNTDTYKFPIGNRVNNGVYNSGVYPGIAKIVPLEEETRKDFKIFN